MDKDIEEQFAQVTVTLADVVKLTDALAQRVTALEAKLNHRPAQPNCPKCGALYRGRAPIGQRTCPLGCSGVRF